MSELEIRPIELSDNATIAKIIRDTLTEFGANHLGTVYYDDTTDHLYELFTNEKNSRYNIALLDNQIVGGAGIFPSSGLDKDTCELVKMYLTTASRGKGIASSLIAKSIEQAKEIGYTKIYLESMPELSTALKIYEKKGWQYLKGPMGNTGHTGCGLWMLLEL